MFGQRSVVYLSDTKINQSTCFYCGQTRIKSTFTDLAKIRRAPFVGGNAIYICNNNSHAIYCQVKVFLFLVYCSLFFFILMTLPFHHCKLLFLFPFSHLVGRSAPPISAIVSAARPSRGHLWQSLALRRNSTSASLKSTVTQPHSATMCRTLPGAVPTPTTADSSKHLTAMVNSTNFWFSICHL